MSELTKRILFAVPGAILFLWMAWLGGWYFWGFMFFITLFTQFEIYRIIKYANNPVNLTLAMVMTVWIFLYPYLPEALMFGQMIFLFLITSELFSHRNDSLVQLLNTTFHGLYAPLGFVSLFLLRNQGSDDQGLFILFSVLLMIWGNDIAAYFGGRAFGKHKLAPHISPKKTWEGFGFGFLGSLSGYFIAVAILQQGIVLQIPAIIIMVLLAGTFGPIGDLTASKFKRAAEVKDSSTLLPGHGGFYDRFDSTLIVAPAMLVFLRLAGVFGFNPFL